MTLTNLARQLSLEESLRDGYRGGKWHSKDDLCYFAFSGEGPALELQVGSYDPPRAYLTYFPEHDSISFFHRDVLTIGSSKPSFGYFKMLGYYQSGSREAFAYATMGRLFKGIKELTTHGAFLFATLVIAPERLIRCWDEWWIEESIAEVGLLVRQKKLLEYTLGAGDWRDNLIDQVKKKINQKFRYIDFSSVFAINEVDV